MLESLGFYLEGLPFHISNLLMFPPPCLPDTSIKNTPETSATSAFLIAYDIYFSDISSISHFFTNKNFPGKIDL